MTQLELDAQSAKALLEQRNRIFIEERLLISQWCTSLVQHYNSATDDIKAKLPPLPGTTAEEMLPSLFVSNPSDLDVEQYKREAAQLVAIQQAMSTLYTAVNQEAMKCLSASTPQN